MKNCCTTRIDTEVFFFFFFFFFFFISEALACLKLRSILILVSKTSVNYPGCVFVIKFTNMKKCNNAWL